MTVERATPGSAVAVGTFDGLHRGHRFVIDRLLHAARLRRLRSVLVTFDPHPLRIVNPAAAPPLLMTPSEKREALGNAGLDEVAVVPFDAHMASLEAHEFVDQVLLGRFAMHELFVGHDHGFGRGRSGDAATLERLGRDRGFGVHVVRPVTDPHGHPVSSSAIRRALARGDLRAATDGLGRPYAVTGVVEHGDGRGASLGFRTINLSSPSAEKLLPADGVYAVRVAIGSDRMAGMLNLGGRPTFGDNRRVIEAHVFDAVGDWYGHTVRVDFLARIRDARRFPGPDELMAQLRQDEQMARLLVARWAVRTA